MVPRLLRLLLQHRLHPHAEEGLRPGRGRVPEGHRAEAELRRRLQRAGDGLQRAEEVRQGAARPARRRPSSPARPVRAGGGGGGVDAEYNQGVIVWNAGQDRRGGRALPEGDLHEAGPRRRALPARHGLREPGQAGRSGADVREVPGARARRPVRGDGEGHPVAASRSRAGMAIPSRRDDDRRESVGGSTPAGPRARAGRPVAFLRPPGRRLEDPSGRGRAGRLRAGQVEFGENRVQEALEKIAAIVRYRRSRGIWSATCSRTRRGRRPRRSPASTRSTASTC